MIDHTLLLHRVCCPVNRESPAGEMEMLKLKCSKRLWDVPVKAIMFVFQELRDDMASVLADVFCILGKSEPANAD